VDGKGAGRRDPFWIVLILLAPLLLFPNLGNRFLWQDEAETALLARSVARHGYPLAHDGRRTISDQPGSPDVNDAGVWIWTPWLQLYPTAVSFALLGESPRNARLPFALAGWASVLLAYGVFRTVVRRRPARIAALLLLCSVPFLLQLRQCRYYAFLAFFTLLHLWGYLRLARAQKGGGAAFTFGALGLYHTLLPQMVASTLALGLDALAVRRDRGLVVRVVGWSLLVAVLCLPFFVYTQGWSRNYLGLGFGFESPARFVSTLRAYLLEVHLYAWPYLWTLLAVCLLSRRRAWAFAALALCPLWLLAIVWTPSSISFVALLILTTAGIGLSLWGVVRAERNDAGLGDGVSSIALLLAVGVLVHALFAPTPYFRYLTGLLPFFALATALTVDSIAGERKLVSAVLIAALCATDLLPRIPLWLGSSIAGLLGEVRALPPPPDELRAGELAWHEADVLSAGILGQGSNPPLAHLWILDYTAELTTDYDGPVEVVIRHLWREAAPGETILVQYEHFPFMYYTDLHVVRWDEAASLERLPEWIFFHGPRREELDAVLRRSLGRYRRVPLDARETGWENIPEPYWHWFQTRREGPRVRLYRLRDDDASGRRGTPRAAEKPHSTSGR
jgi:4-amino-4-deoxy-L-arabinose transferase-like glycosyltransferase